MECQADDEVVAKVGSNVNEGYGHMHNPIELRRAATTGEPWVWVLLSLTLSPVASISNAHI